MSSVTSFAGDSIRRAYIDDATKAVLLGGNGGASFGLVISRATTFKASALEDGPIELVPAQLGGHIVPVQVIVASTQLLEADVTVDLGWLAADAAEGEEREDSQLWLATSPLIALGGDESGSVIVLPNAAAAANATLCPGCMLNRAFVAATPGVVGATTRKEKRSTRRERAEPGAPTRGHTSHERAPELPRVGAQEGDPPEEPDILVAVYYTVV